MIRIRVIPATITTALLLLCVKVIDIAHNSEFLTLEAMAQQQAASPTSTTAKPADKALTKPADAKGKGAAASGTAKEEGEKTEGDCSDKDKEKDKEKKGNPNVSDTMGDIVEHRFTATELEMLQNLVNRQRELDTWERNISLKEEALNATEKRVDDKIGQIESMKKEVTALLSEYNEKEDAKIHSLVKIYQGMKPKDAARIFDELDIPILLLVLDKMPEKNTAPILALMDPKKAKAVTVQLAEQRKLGVVKNLGAAAGIPAIPAPTSPTQGGR